MCGMEFWDCFGHLMRQTKAHRLVWVFLIHTLSENSKFISNFGEVQLNFERYTAQGKYYKLLHSPTYIQHDLSENWYLLMKIPFPLSCHDDSIRAIYEIFLVAVDQWPYNTNENYNVRVNGIDSLKNSLYRKKAMPLQWKWGIIRVITIYLATGIQTKALTFVYPKLIYSFVSMQYQLLLFPFKLNCFKIIEATIKAKTADYHKQ